MRWIELAGGVGELLVGDCVEGMRGLAERSVDAVVCDPPYGLEFMGKEWDKLDAGLPQEAQWKGRRGKGGASTNVDRDRKGRVDFGGRRSQFKRCARCGKREFSGSPCVCADPDWRVEYPEGPPSSAVRMQRWHEQWARELLRVCKPGAHVVAFGGQRTIHRLTCALEDAGFDVRDQLQWLQWQGFPKSLDLGKAVPAELAKGALAGARRYLGGEVVDEVFAEVARRFEGVGTALKPAAEPAVLCRRPVEGTIAANALAWGVGGLRIDDCRLAPGDFAWPGPSAANSKPGGLQRKKRRPVSGLKDPCDEYEVPPDMPRGGRWPANVYYCPKPSTSERERGLEHFARATPGELTGGRAEGSAGLSSPRAGAGRTAREGRANTHPTVKPVGLMRWLVRLACSPGGLVLDPFLGSGTTAIACGLEGRRVLGFEVSDEYATIAEARVAGWAGEFT